jgi:membrane protease YdiL (CAAX protease family)
MIANSDQQTSATIFGDRVLAAWEIVSVCSSIVIAEWMLASAVGFSKALTAVPVALALFLMYVSHRMRNESLRDLGLRFDNFFRALYLLAVPVAAFALLCLIVGWRMGGALNFFRWHPGRYLVLQLIVGFLWGVLQQYALQSFINRRAMICVGRGVPSILIVAVIFGLLHLPNVWVAGLTLIGGVVWAAVYQRVPNIFALALSHAVMTWFVVSTLPPSVLRHLRVGIGYFG